MKQLQTFVIHGQTQKINFIETVEVNDSVECDVYSFDADKDKDLGIIRIMNGGKTPLQKILKGTKTIEGYIFGTGSFEVQKSDGEKRLYKVNPANKEFSVELGIGDTMQWFADQNSELVAYEVCYPPYEEGRYENLPE